MTKPYLLELSSGSLRYVEGRVYYARCKSLENCALHMIISGRFLTEGSTEKETCNCSVPIVMS